MPLPVGYQLAAFGSHTAPCAAINSTTSALLVDTANGGLPAGATPFTITGTLTIGGTVTLAAAAPSGTLRNYLTGYLIVVTTAMTGTATVTLVDGSSSTNKIIDGMATTAAVGTRLAFGPGSPILVGTAATATNLTLGGASAGAVQASMWGYTA